MQREDVDVNAAAALLGVSKEYVRVLVARGAIAHKRGDKGRIVFRKEDLEQYEQLRQQRREQADKRLLLRGEAWAEELRSRMNDDRTSKALHHVTAALEILRHP